MKTITALFKGSSVSVCPERGGIITSIKIKGREVLYMDEKTLWDKKVNVKGGIPILFPQAGAIPEQMPGKVVHSGLKKHGFARDSTEWQYETYGQTVFESLKWNEETLPAYPYHFTLLQIARLRKNGSCIIQQSVHNTNGDYPGIPVSYGLHPYFPVRHSDKPGIRFNFHGGEELERRIEEWSNGKSVSIDNPGIMRIKLPRLGTLILEATPEFRKIWVWSLPQDFICIEPVMRDKGGIVSDPVIVDPFSTVSSQLIIALEPE